jgi:tetratricopeptide (TPR) repeat protein
MRRPTLLACALSILVSTPAQPCTIVAGRAADGTAWVGNNEDYFFDFETFLNVIPRRGAEFGAVTFTYDTPEGSIQGGVNEKGLFFDFNAVPAADASAYAGWAAKRDFPGGEQALLRQILTSCGTVTEVLALLDRFRLPGLLSSQLHLADREGTLAIVNADAVKLTRDAFQVSTNFNVSTQANSEAARTCWRFATAGRILRAGGVSILSVRDALEATRQPRTVSTIYSNILNLRTGELYLYYAGDFEHPYRVQIADLLARGRRSYNMRSLFPDAPIVRIWNTYRTRGAEQALTMYRALEDGIPENRRAELMRYIFLSCLLYTNEYSGAAIFYREWQRIDGGKDKAAGLYDAWVRIATGDRDGARRALEAQVEVEKTDDMAAGRPAQRTLLRLIGATLPGADVHLQLRGHREARCVALYLPGQPAIFRFLVPTSDGWAGDFEFGKGKTYYAFVVDGKMMPDPANSRRETYSDEGIKRSMSVKVIDGSPERR